MVKRPRETIPVLREKPERQEVRDIISRADTPSDIEIILYAEFASAVEGVQKFGFDTSTCPSLSTAITRLRNVKEQVQLGKYNDAVFFIVPPCTLPQIKHALVSRHRGLPKCFFSTFNFRYKRAPKGHLWGPETNAAWQFCIAEGFSEPEDDHQVIVNLPDELPKEAVEQQKAYFSTQHFARKEPVMEGIINYLAMLLRLIAARKIPANHTATILNASKIVDAHSMIGIGSVHRRGDAYMINCTANDTVFYSGQNHIRRCFTF